MGIIEAILIAIVEGLTEFLPVSSTGHMIIAQSLLGVESDEFVKAFTVIIQFGAILSVIVLYWQRFFQTWSFYLKLFIGFLPAAVLGLLFSNKIDALLENVTVVALMLVLGGVLMLFVDRWFHKPILEGQTEISSKNAFIIGCFQCIAMIPGVSRSMATIVGGMTRGLTRRDAAEFSFFLAVPTMAGATAKKLYDLVHVKEGGILDLNLTLLQVHWQELLIGNIVAFVVALIAIKVFIQFVSKYGFKLFGYYRIVVGGIILIMMLLGYDLTIM